MAQQQQSMSRWLDNSKARAAGSTIQQSTSRWLNNTAKHEPLAQQYSKARAAGSKEPLAHNSKVRAAGSTTVRAAGSTTVKYYTSRWLNNSKVYVRAAGLTLQQQSLSRCWLYKGGASL